MHSVRDAMQNKDINKKELQLVQAYGLVADKVLSILFPENYQSFIEQYNSNNQPKPTNRPPKKGKPPPDLVT